MTYRTAVYNGPEGFEAVRTHWEALAPHAEFFCQLPQWLENVTANGVSWFAVTDDDQPIAAAVLSPQRRSAWGKGIRVLGGVRQAFDGFDQDRGLPFGALAITHPMADKRIVAKALLTEYQRAGANWDVLRLGELREGSLWAASRLGRIERDYPGGAGILDTSMPSSQFWVAASRNLRDALRKSQRRMERDRRRSVVIEATTPDQVAAAFEAFIELEGQGWKATTGGAFVSRPQTADLVRRFLVSAAASRRISLRSLLIDDRLAAAQLTVQVGDSLFLWKVAYDEDQQDLSPGNLLMADLVSKACDDPSINRIDCLVRAAWHDRWGMAVAPMYHVIAFNPRTPTGLATGTAWRGMRTSSNLWRRSRRLITERGRSTAHPNA